MAIVQYTGPRRMPMRVHVYVNGQRFNGQGYLFGQRRGYGSALVTEEEADVLTGAIPPLTAPGLQTPINGFVVAASLNEEQLALETWQKVGE